MKKILLALFILTVHFSFSQYCGTSGPGICTPGGLTAPGITNYQTFPCVKQGQAFNEVIQVFFPDTASQLGLSIPVSSIRIDSITNLPCGLCWECDNSTFTYAGGTQACIKISGTTTDVVGTYQLKMYGTAVTAFGAFPGSLEVLGYQFFLNVVPAASNCAPVNIMDLNVACSGTPVEPACNFDVQLSASYFGAACNYDSAAITIVSPLGNGYKFYWSKIDWNAGTITVDSVNTTIVAVGEAPYLSIVDSNGCYKSVDLTYSPSIGAIHLPTICYSTYDTSATGMDNSLQVVFQRDDWFGTMSTYNLYGQITENGTPVLVASIPANAEGRIVDTNPAAYLYGLGGTSICGAGIQPQIPLTYQPAQLYVGDGFGNGYPLLSWNHSVPITYDAVYIYSRTGSGHWRLRFSTMDLSDSSWIDLHPDSAQMEYMLGFKLNVSCDPSRATDEMIFTNFDTIAVAEELVDTSEIIDPVGIKAVEINKFVFYPNPTEHVLYLQFANTTISQELKAIVYNSMGQVVISEVVSTTQVNKLNVEALTPGLYMIAVQGQGYGGAMQKFIKK